MPSQKHPKRTLPLYRHKKPKIRHSDPDPVDHWQGWWIDEDYLHDPGGNAYHIDEIRALFFTRQFINSVRGKSHNILNLKQQLEKRIAAMQPPRIIVEYQDGKRYEISHQQGVR